MLLIAKTLLLPAWNCGWQVTWKWEIKASGYIRDALALQKDTAIRLAIKSSEATSIPVSCEPYWCGPCHTLNFSSVATLNTSSDPLELILAVNIANAWICKISKSIWRCQIAWQEIRVAMKTASRISSRDEKIKIWMEARYGRHAENTVRVDWKIALSVTGPTQS